MLFPALQAHQLERRPRALESLLLRDAGIDQGKLDVFERGGSSQQVESLEYKPDPAVANGCQLARCAVENLTGFVDAALDPLAKRRRIVEQVVQLREVAAAPCCQPRREEALANLIAVGTAEKPDDEDEEEKE